MLNLSVLGLSIGYHFIKFATIVGEESIRMIQTRRVLSRDRGHRRPWQLLSGLVIGYGSRRLRFTSVTVTPASRITDLLPVFDGGWPLLGNISCRIIAAMRVSEWVDCLSLHTTTAQLGDIVQVKERKASK